ncbi:hypothetical protein Cni_G03039 [Canna indica]|uniref:ABC transporter domain-containing protein n=1 Tax=Canna indica TaxID=4628 RepID=A0AAQ3JSH0_9LILI|nr:hypothetical protein Cni_G03039 [Canna indica]
MAAEIAQEMRPIAAQPADHVVRVEPAVAGVHLTWEDLWVTGSNGKGATRVILAGLTGYAQPGEVLAIMGPSGCGKSTLLDALAGRLGSSVRQSGHIFINGRRRSDLSFGTSAYVTQDDILMTTLTVREAVYYSAQLQLPKSMSKSEKRERAEMTIREMGLQDAMDTRIGGNYTSRGISGGQKRRVSICIEILTRPKLLFLDEPTSGLDSAASYHVMRRIANLAKHDGRTIIASIHQPSSEVFDLFDNLCLLSSGKTVYFGPASRTNEFFALNGFPCPTFRNPSDHYLRTINMDFDKESDEGSSKKVSEAHKATHVLTTSYSKSLACQDVARRVAQICSIEGDLIKNKRECSFISQCLVLTKRSFVNMYRDLGYYWLRLAIYIALCVCIGTMFYDLGHDYESIQDRSSMLMFVAGFLTFMAIGGFPSFVEDMKIFRRERLNGHYGVTAFVISNTLSSAPYLALVSLIPASLAYYLAGLQRGFDHFIFFCLVLYMCMVLVEGLMMIVASLVPNFLMGIITGAGIQAVMILAGGFFKLPRGIPNVVWKFPVYHISYCKYANQGYFKNEFIGLMFPSITGEGMITGDSIVKYYWQMQVGYSKWVDLAILVGMMIFYRVLFILIIKASEKFKPLVTGLLNAPPKKTMQIMEQPPEDDEETNH